MNRQAHPELEATLQQPTIHEVWENRYRTVQSEQFYEMACDWLVGHVGIEGSSRLLDAGCGIGAHALRWARRGFQVEAVDYSAERVTRARENAAQAGFDGIIHVSQGDLTAGLPFAASSFDVVFCWGVLMHIPDVEAAILELIRLTRPGGRIIIGENTTYSIDTLGTFLRTKLGAPGRRLEFTTFGREYWTPTPSGKLFIRHSSPDGLRAFFEQNGCKLRHRVSGQFTELFTRLPARAASVIHAWNKLWFRMGALPWFACGNIFVFERTC